MGRNENFNLIIPIQQEKSTGLHSEKIRKFQAFSGKKGIIHFDWKIYQFDWG